MPTTPMRHETTTSTSHPEPRLAELTTASPAGAPRPADRVTRALDQDHAELASLTARLHAVREDRSALTDALEDLARSLRDHFAEEEHASGLYGIVSVKGPELQARIATLVAEHRSLRQDLEHLVTLAQERPAPPASWGAPPRTWPPASTTTRLGSPSWSRRWPERPRPRRDAFPPGRQRRTSQAPPSAGTPSAGPGTYPDQSLVPGPLGADRGPAHQQGPASAPTRSSGARGSAATSAARCWCRPPPSCARSPRPA